MAFFDFFHVGLLQHRHLLLIALLRSCGELGIQLCDLRRRFSLAHQGLCLANNLNLRRTFNFSETIRVVAINIYFYITLIQNDIDKLAIEEIDLIITRLAQIHLLGECIVALYHHSILPSRSAILYFLYDYLTILRKSNFTAHDDRPACASSLFLR